MVRPARLLSVLVGKFGHIFGCCKQGKAIKHMRFCIHNTCPYLRTPVLSGTPPRPRFFPTSFASLRLCEKSAPSRTHFLNHVHPLSCASCYPVKKSSFETLYVTVSASSCTKWHGHHAHGPYTGETPVSRCHRIRVCRPPSGADAQLGKGEREEKGNANPQRRGEGDEKDFVLACRSMGILPMILTRSGHPPDDGGQASAAWGTAVLFALRGTAPPGTEKSQS